MAPKPHQRVDTRTRAAAGDGDPFTRLLHANTVDVGRSAARRRRRSPVLGKLALGLAVVSLAVDASAFAVFMGGEMRFATGISLAVVFLTLVAAVLGFVAAVGALGRWYGVVAVVLAFAANPVVLAVVLAFAAPDVAVLLGDTTP